MKQSRNDDEIPSGIGEQGDGCVSERILSDNRGAEPTLPLGITMAHIAECCVAMLAGSTLCGHAGIQQIESRGSEPLYFNHIAEFG
jgi:hypothetical protein